MVQNHSDMLFHKFNLTFGYVMFSPCVNNFLPEVARFSRILTPAWSSPDTEFCENNAFQATISQIPSQLPVQGVLGCWYSSCTQLLSTNLQYFRIPILATEASSDKLSNKLEHPFTARLVARDSYQAEVSSLHTISHHYLRTHSSVQVYYERWFGLIFRY